MDAFSNWEEILKRFYEAQKAPPLRPDLNDIVDMARGKKRMPEDLDPGLREMVEMVAEWENYEWNRAPAPNPFELLVCRVREKVDVLLSSLQWQAQAAGVRSGSGASLPVVRTRTEEGVELAMSPDAGHSAARLTLSFPGNTAAPERVELKRDGQLMDSVPVLGESVEFMLPVPGIYELVLCHPDFRRPLLALTLEPSPDEEDPA